MESSAAKGVAISLIPDGRFRLIALNRSKVRSRAASARLSAYLSCTLLWYRSLCPPVILVDRDESLTRIGASGECDLFESAEVEKESPWFSIRWRILTSPSALLADAAHFTRSVDGTGTSSPLLPH